MTPVKFNGSNVTFAADQPEYQPLPAYKDNEGNVITEWQLTEEEKVKILGGANLRINIMTFNHPIQPISPEVIDIEIPMKPGQLNEITPQQYVLQHSNIHGTIDVQHINRIIQLSKLQHLNPAERLGYLSTATVPDYTDIEKCECGHYAPLGFAYGDTEGIKTCSACVIEELHDRIKSLRRVNENVYTEKDKQRNQPLFDLMESHGLTLLESEIQEIINTVNAMKT